MRVEFNKKGIPLFDWWIVTNIGDGLIGDFVTYKVGRAGTNKGEKYVKNVRSKEIAKTIWEHYNQFQPQPVNVLFNYAKKKN